jgi:RNA polymerase sigma-70 factor (ECF subfamily)
MIDTMADTTGLAQAVPSERARLVRLCVRLTGNLDAAEDLAQETLYEAWRNAHKLRDHADAAGRAQWLSAIARNVCLRWARRRGRELSRLASAPHAAPDQEAATATPGLDEYLADRFDLEIELERHELVRLLDRAMALLPPDTRRVLVERYVEEAPQAETALRLGLSEGAVAMRLQRGKLALRRLLSTEFAREAAAYGLLDATDGAWQETRIWCPVCGRRRLVGVLDHAGGWLLLRCLACQRSPGEFFERTRDSRMFASVKGYRPAYSRVLAFVAGYYQRSRRQNPMPCPACGFPVVVRPAFPEWYGVRYQCERCRHGADSGFTAVILGLAEGRQFWREHPRIRLLPLRELEAAGSPAYVISYESLGSHARLDAVATRETCDLIAVHRTPRA